MNVCLDVEHLCVSYPTSVDAARPIAVVNDVSFQIHAGECLGIVGESGSGKTQIFMAIMGLLGERARLAGNARFKGQELLGLEADAMNRLRGAQLAMVFQDPMTALTPHLTIETQLREVLETHSPEESAATAQARVLAMLESVRIPEPAKRLRQYPHELSGGMRQRILIAIACLSRPALLIADEPTTALDTTVQAQVLDVLRSLRRETGTAVALVTHDVALLAGFADRVIVMYAGRIVESAPVAALFARPLHPYSLGLLQCVPRWSDARVARLPSIPGIPPDPAKPMEGCDFAPRCLRVQALCKAVRPTLQRRADGRELACHFPNDEA